MSDVTVRIDRALQDLRSLGAEIANQDFGYPVAESTFESAADASRIGTIAALIETPLPADYTYFLSQCGGFVGMDFHNGYVVHTPEEVVRFLRESSSPQRVTTADGVVPVLPVASDGGGYLFLLQVGATHGVLRWDHETGGGSDALSSTPESLQPIADSFASFLERIRDDWSHFLGDDPGSWAYIT
jgi:hypothetical protein